MKHSYSLTTILLTLLFTFSALAKSDSIRVECQLSGCSQTLYLYEFNGFEFEEVARASREGADLFVFNIPASKPQFYYVGMRKNQTKPIVLKDEKLVKLRGNCRSMRGAQASGARLYSDYQKLRGQLSKLARGSNTQMRALSKAYREKDESATGAIIEELKKIDLQKTALLDSIRREDPFLYQIAGFNTMLSYQNNPGAYNNEIEYFGNEFFRFVDLGDPALQGNSMVYEAFLNYTKTLSQVGLPAETHLAFLQKNLARTGKNDAVYKLAMGGVLSALERTSNANYKPLAKQFIERFKDSDPAACAIVEQKMIALRGIMIGGEAPDFAQETPEGEEIKLSDLRGKVVLIDFWASWCGPCRRENPNVVRLYNQYKDKGFEILGVSLDRDKKRWTQAIEADQLEWLHVSDLKQWSNAVAKMYGVRSIPHTVLLDAEGKVIANKLRGESLARKLEEIFGEEAKGDGK